MANQPKKIYEVDGRQFASQEEIHFYLWCREAQQAGIIRTWAYQPRTFELSPKVTVPRQVPTRSGVKTIEQHLLNSCTYTPDFQLLPGPAFDMVAPLLYSTDGRGVWIDIKGKFDMHGGGQFSVIKKWTYQVHGVYIVKLIPVDFFEKSFVPRRAAYKRNGERRTPYSACRLLDQFMQNYNPGLF